MPWLCSALVRRMVLMPSRLNSSVERLAFKVGFVGDQDNWFFAFEGFFGH